MDVYTTEEQQVEAIKKWWRDNKLSIIGGVIIGIAALWGGRSWVASQEAHAEAASDLYQMMMTKLQAGQLEAAASDGSTLLGQFSDTPYADLASLALARIKVGQGDLDAASSHLNWARGNTRQEELKTIASLRLAEIELARGNTAAALGLLDGIASPGSFTAAVEQLRGDVLKAEGKDGQAREAYQRSLAAMAPNAPGRRLLQIKLDDLGGGDPA